MTKRLWIARAAELVTLSSFAVAQPLFDLLGHQATFFVAHRAGPVRIVALAALLLVGPPFMLLACVFVASWLSDRAARLTQSSALGVLAGLTIAPPVARWLDGRASVWGLVFLIVAAMVIWAHERWRVSRRAASWALVAPIVFTATFIFGTSARSLIVPSAPRAARASRAADVPVVMLVFDEFPLGAILRPDGEIDAVRFPNFARLASLSTWYRNATTNSDGTVAAIPALLTGTWLRENHLPTSQAYPNNLLTYMGRTFPIDASEFVTALCADDVCGGSRAAGRSSELVWDTGVVYLSAVLPKTVAGRWLPSISHQWAGFGRETSPAIPREPAVRTMIDKALEGDEAARVTAFLSRLAPADGPRLWYLHVGLPHVPWHYLPTGQMYSGGAVAGLTPDERWGDDRAVDLGLQRFLLQLTFVDHLVGQFLDRLHATRLDDRALVVVVADHGASFRAGSSRRDFDASHPADILPIPLFIKYPGQAQAAVDPRNAELVDVLPTIAAVLGMAIPWAVDGSSLKTAAATRPDKHLFTRLHGVVAHEITVAGRQELPARIESLFDGAGEADDLYRIGPFPDLLGTVASSSGPPPTTAPPLDLEQAEAFAAIEPQSAVLPVLLSATMPQGVPAGTPVAVALNNVVSGLGWVISADGETRISVMLAPRFLKRGENEVAVYRVMPDATLSLVGRLDHRTYRLVAGGAGGAISKIVAPDGRVIAVRTGTYQGLIDRFIRSGAFVQFSGWAADPSSGRVPALFLVTQRQQVVATALPWSRPDVSAYFKAPALINSGITLSTAALTDDKAVAVYAIFSDGAYLVPILPSRAAPDAK